jgi:hypothetical protein
MFEEILASEQANKTAVILASEKYNERLSKFVKNSSSRMEFVADDIARIVDEVCKATGADPDYVASRLDDHLSKAILDKDHAKREKLKVKKE